MKRASNLKDHPLATARNEARPLSPHATVYKIGPHMLVSFVHRITGTGMATIGGLLFVWWLSALAEGGPAYGVFLDMFTLKSGALSWLGYLFGIGFTLVLFQHMASGVRHLFMDEGANFELGPNKITALLTFGFALIATAGFWLVILEKTYG
jgi:succinate dehydrogenase / fumarate reductase cytochrome b subunit